MSRRPCAVRAAATVILDLLLPRVCVSCGRGIGPGLAGSSPLCVSCLSQLGGAKPLILGDLRVCPLLSHSGPARDLVHTLKYHGRGDVARFLAARMTEDGALLGEPLSDPAPILVPVPLYRRRERARGYNQSALLARALAAHLPPLGVASLIIRRRPTRSQTALDRSQRAANVAGAFAPVEPAKQAGVPDLASRPAILVDDVVTTGATLIAAAEALSAVTHGRIAAVVAARADGGRDVAVAKPS